PGGLCALALFDPAQGAYWRTTPPSRRGGGGNGAVACMTVQPGISLLSCAALLLEVALTRLFSFTLWYHFAYLTIGVALLGYGGSGALLAACERRLPAEPERLLRPLALIAGLTIPVMLVGVARVPFDPFLLLPPLSIATN